MKNKKIERLLYKSLDRNLSDREAEALSKELQSSEAFRKDYERIKKIREAVSNSAQTSFKPFFEERLLNKIKYPVQAEENTNLLINSLVISFRKFALTGLVVLVLLVSYNLCSGNKYSFESLLGISSTTFDYAFNPINILVGNG